MSIWHKRHSSCRFSPSCQHLDCYNWLGRLSVKLLGVHVEDGCGCMIPKTLAWRVRELLYGLQPRPYCVMCDFEPEDEQCLTC